MACQISTPTLAAAPQIVAPAAAASRSDSSLPSAAQVLASVRQAVGYRSLAAMPNGYSINEKRAGQQGEANTIQFGTLRGEMRNGDEFGFDGSYAWQHDSRRNRAVPSPQRQREKFAWPLWVRGHWWLNPKSGMNIAVLPAESDGQTVALSLSLPEGLVPATLYVDRSTWLPSRLVVPYERGPFTARYADYRDVHGLKIPFTVDTSYRTESRSQVLLMALNPDLSDFAAPSLPADHSFDPAKPAALETTAGVPFGPGSPGHNYARAAADGQSGWWHLDSGSDSMIIDTAVADALGMEIIGTHRSMGADGKAKEGTWRRGKSFMLGRIRIENPVYRAIDLSQNNAPPGKRRMGTIGYDLFARSVVEYSGGGTNVRICDPRRYRLPSGARWQKLEHIDATPAFRGTVDGRLEGLFQVDTGAAGTIDFAQPFHERHGLLKGRATDSLELLGSGGSFSVERGRLDRFDFADRRYDKLEVTFRTGGVSREGSAGTIGRTLLEPFTTIFDYSHHRVAFVPAGKQGRCN
jgi:hypothetical protein